MLQYCQADLIIQATSIIECPQHQGTRNEQNIQTNFKEDLNKDNSIKIINFLSKINIVNNL